MISFPDVRSDVIRRHYDISTLFYRMLWGPHIHHGLWHADETPRQAQLQLTQTLARLARIERGAHILDVGCGMGGSSIHLAQELDCDVTGVTLSGFQRRWASWSSRWAGVGGRTRFLRQDVESFSPPDKDFDVVWSVECTEHLFDKPRFFQRAATWLRPGGRMAICAWLAGEHEQDPNHAQQVRDVCEGFFCPSLGTAADYVAWFQAAGLRMEEQQDWTSQVLRTWEICRRRVQWTGMPWLAKFCGADARLFLRRFDTILEAYRSGAMAYGGFVAHRPE